MSEPSVCCLCLTADRQRLTDRAVQCFLDQRAAVKRWLLIYDTGQIPYDLPLSAALQSRQQQTSIVVVYSKPNTKRTIGTLRNEALSMCGRAEVIMHWDSDDWSDPRRLEKQYIQLVTEGFKVAGVGFHNLLFCDTRMSGHDPHYDRAWEYDYFRPDRVVGTSLCYWRLAWERLPFVENRVSGEDTEWHKSVPVRGFNGVGEPLLIAEVHGSNTSPVYAVFDNHSVHDQKEWRRAPEFDAFCRERLYP